mgnify:CR=1 FL=1
MIYGSMSVEHMLGEVEHESALSFDSGPFSVPQVALDQVCQGYWLEFADLDDERRFSSSFGVLGQVVNSPLDRPVCGWSISSRWISPDDRTPYAVWRFVVF